MPANETFSEIANYISTNTPLQSVILTDCPSKLAWYTDRHTVWLPDIHDLNTIQNKYSRIDGILLTSSIRELTPDPIVEEWKKIYVQHALIDNFQLSQIFHNGSLYYQRK